MSFKSGANEGKDNDIKPFTAKGVPVLQHHLAMAKSLNDQLTNTAKQTI